MQINPITNPPITQAIPTGLETIGQFVLWKQENGERIPCDRRGYSINAFAPNNQSTPGSLFASEIGPHLGLALVLKPDDPLFCIDLDNVFNPATGWSLLAQDVIQLFQGAYFEVSASGCGAHIIGCGADAAPADHRCRITPNLEFYTHSKVISLTGISKTGNALADMRPQIREFIARYQVGVRETVSLQAGPVQFYEGPTDDNVLAQAMCGAPGSFPMMYNEKCHPRYLWVGEAAEIAKYYPASGTRQDCLPYDASAADMALCGHLAFWTGKDAGRIERMWLASALGQRPKVQVRADYRARTITAAIAGRRAIYDTHFKRKLTSNIGVDEVVTEIKPLILSLEEMQDKLVYIEATGEVVHWDLGRPRSWTNAVGAYAGSVHSWETTDGKFKESPAITVWRRSQLRKSVDVQTWAPGKSKICLPPEFTSGNSRAFNTWLGFRQYIATSNAAELARPFIEHIEYLIPIEHERKRFMQWVAHIQQRPDILPHTCYLMVTKQTGIGRNWVASVLARVFRGYAAVGVKISAILDGGFNGILSQKLIAFVDEAREGMSERKYEKAQALKELITQEARLINPKYGCQAVEYNCCRWLMFSNHLDALPIDEMDRRIVIIQNPTERRAQEEYAKLYNLIHNNTFISAIYHYLQQYDISDFNPGEPAQMTEIKEKAISAGLSELDRIVRDFKEDYKGQIATLETLRSFINQANLSERITDRALHYAIEHAGMERVSGRYCINGVKNVALICVKGVTAADIKLMSMFQLRDHLATTKG